MPPISDHCGKSTKREPELINKHGALAILRNDKIDIESKIWILAANWIMASWLYWVSRRGGRTSSYPVSTKSTTGDRSIDRSMDEISTFCSWSCHSVSHSDCLLRGGTPKSVVGLEISNLLLIKNWGLRDYHEHLLFNAIHQFQVRDYY